MNYDKIKFGIIGCGNMGQIVLESLLLIKNVLPENIFVSDIDKKKLQLLNKKYFVKTLNCNKELTNITNIIILAVKPQQIKLVLEEIRHFINQEKLIVSIAAGVKMCFIESFLNKKVSVIRCMPNLPLKVGFGLTAVCCNKNVSKKQNLFVKELFSVRGKVIFINENKMDSITAISGSGPAYIFYISEIMQQIATKFGFNKKEAELLVNQTILGSAQMLNLSCFSAKELKEAVTSKGGTTQQALSVFYKNQLLKIFLKAIKSAKNRAKELSKIL